MTFFWRCPLSVEYLDRVVDAEDYIQLHAEKLKAIHEVPSLMEVGKDHSSMRIMRCTCTYKIVPGYYKGSFLVPLV